MTSVEELRAAHARRMTADEVLSIDYHRNGVGGDGFYVALVRAHEADHRVLTVIVPGWAVEAVRDGKDAAEVCPSGTYPCYAIDPTLAAGPWTNPGTVEFGVNSWRGDHYFDLVVNAAIEWEKTW
jgi:hypothetical protein